MQYLNIDVDYFNHPKTIRFCCELGGHRAEILPIRLWAHVAKYHAENAYLKGYSPDVIAKILGWKEDAEKLIQALLNCGFVEAKKDGFLVHDFSEHNGHLALYKERGRIAAAARWNKMRPAPADKKTQAAAKPGKPEKTQNPAAFTDHQLNELRLALCKKLGSSMISEYTQTTFDELLRKLKTAFAKKTPDNPYAYALACARNYGDKQK